MEDPLDGRTALVTGTSSGIDATTARALAKGGTNVCPAARRVEQLESLADEVCDATDAAVNVVPTDVADSDTVRALVDVAIERFGSSDIVACNAGFDIDKPTVELIDEEYRLMIGVNVDGMFYTARETLPHLETPGGSLIFLESMSGNHPRPHNPIYAATKWWVHGFTSSLRGSIDGENVGMTRANPAEVRTEFGSESDETLEAPFEEGEVVEVIEMIDVIAYAVHQRSPNTTLSLGLYRRNKLSYF